MRACACMRACVCPMHTGISVTRAGSLIMPVCVPSVHEYATRLVSMLHCPSSFFDARVFLLFPMRTPFGNQPLNLCYDIMCPVLMYTCIV